MGGNADSVVPYDKLHLIPDEARRKGDKRFASMIAGRILQELSQDKTDPFVVGIYLIV